MKRECYILLLLFVVLLSLGSCTKTDDGSYVHPITLYEKISGTWALSSVKMVDEIAVVHASSLTEVDLTTQLNFSTFKLVLNVDESGNPTTYQVQGDVPELFAKTGYWQLDNPYPHTDASASKILLYSDVAKTQLTDQLTITTIPGSTAVLEFKLTRSTTDQVPFVSYQYKLKQAN